MLLAAMDTLLKNGCDKTGPMMGMPLNMAIMMGKKLPNRLRMPKISISMPNIGQPMSTSTMPPRNESVPRSLLGRLKKMNVFLKPINRVMPRRKRS